MSKKDPMTLANWQSSGEYPDLEYVRIGRFSRYHLGWLNDFHQRHKVNGIGIGTKVKETK